MSWTARNVGLLTLVRMEIQPNMIAIGNAVLELEWGRMSKGDKIVMDQLMEEILVALVLTLEVIKEIGT